MLLIFHVIVASASLSLATLLFWLPSRFKLYATYGLAGLTLASGSYLVWTKPAHILKACVLGLLYLGFVSFVLAVSHSKLTMAKAQNPKIE